MADHKVGEWVICNGHEGCIRTICTGQLTGMAEVALDRGSVCVDLCELEPILRPSCRRAITEAERILVKAADQFNWHSSRAIPEGLRILLRAQYHLNAQR